jgi:hypothetical protein
MGPSSTRSARVAKEEMMGVLCKVQRVDTEASNGRMVDGVRVTCGRCGRTAEACGTKRASVRYCLVQLRKKCPEGVFYDVDLPGWCYR